jgi:hypothetical protein
VFESSFPTGDFAPPGRIDTAGELYGVHAATDKGHPRSLGVASVVEARRQTLLVCTARRSTSPPLSPRPGFSSLDLFRAHIFMDDQRPFTAMRGGRDAAIGSLATITFRQVHRVRD